MASGLTLFVMAYMVYGYFLGSVNGLPPLPKDYRPGQHPDPSLEATDITNDAERRLQQAFGDNCEEIKHPIRPWIGKMRIALAAGRYEILPDGRLRLETFSLAHFGKEIGKETGQGQVPEINTANSDQAFITFDRPIKTLFDIGNRKIVFCQLVGNIKLRNNRRTLQQEDDIVVFVNDEKDQDGKRKEQSLNFDESKHLIWTDASVKLIDYQSKPEPVFITATGLEIRLAADNSTAKPGQPAARKPKSDGVSGVESITLRSNVHMDLWDSGSGFLAPAKANSAPTPPERTAASKPTSLPEVPSKPADAVAPRSKVIITTYGPFRYDVVKEHAQFDIPPSSGALEEKVVVTRYHPIKMRTLLERLLEPPVAVEWQSEDLLDLMARRHPAPKQDVLRCDHLELQFHRKSATSQKPGSEDRSADLEIESAHATGKLVTIRSDADNFKAEGNDFTFVAQDRLSILKGDQKIRAAQDGTKIVARELHLLDKTGAQQVKAVGPGAIEMYDRATHKSPHRARFDHELVSTREGTFDVITIRGNAALVDDEQLSIEMEDLFKDEELLKAKSLIKADSLKIWLEQREAGDLRAGFGVGAGKPAPAAPPRSRGARSRSFPGNVYPRHRSPGSLVQGSTAGPGPNAGCRGVGQEDGGSRIEDRGSRIEDQRSRIKDRRSKIEDRRSKIEDRGWRSDGSILHPPSSILHPPSSILSPIHHLNTRQCSPAVRPERPLGEGIRLPDGRQERAGKALGRR